jgi:hypothetical protein
VLISMALITTKLKIITDTRKINIITDILNM